MARNSAGKRKTKPTGSSERSPELDAAEEFVTDLPDREVMSLLPTSVGSLSGIGGLGGGLLGGDTATQPVSAPTSTPSVPLDTNPLSGQSLVGADQTAPIAQQSSSST